MSIIDDFFNYDLGERPHSPDPEPEQSQSVESERLFDSFVNSVCVSGLNIFDFSLDGRPEDSDDEPMSDEPQDAYQPDESLEDGGCEDEVSDSSFRRQELDEAVLGSCSEISRDHSHGDDGDMEPQSERVSAALCIASYSGRFK